MDSPHTLPHTLLGMFLHSPPALPLPLLYILPPSDDSLGARHSLSHTRSPRASTSHSHTQSPPHSDGIPAHTATCTFHSPLCSSLLQHTHQAVRFHARLVAMHILLHR